VTYRDYLVDPSDLVDTDAQDWLDDRTTLHTGGRTVTPMTDAVFAADWARRKREAAA
jgi:hypothetical protein